MTSVDNSGEKAEIPPLKHRVQNFCSRCFRFLKIPAPMSTDSIDRILMRLDDIEETLLKMSAAISELSSLLIQYEGEDEADAPTVSLDGTVSSSPRDQDQPL